MKALRSASTSRNACRCLSEVIDGVVAAAHHIAPPVATSKSPASAGRVWHVACFDASAILDGEGVGEDGGLNLLWWAIYGMNLGCMNVVEERCR